jgi:hypothetical protein
MAMLDSSPDNKLKHSGRSPQHGYVNKSVRILEGREKIEM